MSNKYTRKIDKRDLTIFANKYKKNLVEAARVFSRYLADKQIDYVYQNSDGTLQHQTVLYLGTRFAHLVGLHFIDDQRDSSFLWRVATDQVDLQKIRTDGRDLPISKLKLLTQFGRLVTGTSLSFEPNMENLEKAKSTNIQSGVLSTQDLFIGLRNMTEDVGLTFPATLLKANSKNGLRDVEKNKIVAVYARADDNDDFKWYGLDMTYFKSIEHVQQLESIAGHRLSMTDLESIPAIEDSVQMPMLNKKEFKTIDPFKRRDRRNKMMDIQYQPQIFVADLARYNEGSYNQDGWLKLPMTDEEFDKKMKELIPGEEMIILDTDNMPFSVSEWDSPRDLNEFVRDNQQAIEQYNRSIYGDDASEQAFLSVDEKIGRTLSVADTLGIVPSEEGGPEIVNYSFLQELAASRVDNTTDVAENLYDKLNDLLDAVNNADKYYWINGIGKTEPATEQEYAEWTAYDEDPDAWQEQHPNQEEPEQILTTDDVEMIATGVIINDLNLNVSDETQRAVAEENYDFNNPEYLHEELGHVLGSINPNSDYYVFSNERADPATGDDLKALQSTIQDKFKDLYAEQHGLDNSMNISQTKNQNFNI